jgi:glyceraldehyde-3-phosphate dehydrogenase/erythrose-4-phosphate dehydrogenase
MIPTKTGAAAAVGLVLPELNGKLDGFAMRVPTINVSIVDLSFIAARDTTVEEVNAHDEGGRRGRLKGILGYNTAPLVSVDFNHDPRSSSIFDATLTKVSAGTLVKVCRAGTTTSGASATACSTPRVDERAIATRRPAVPIRRRRFQDGHPEK